MKLITNREMQALEHEAFSSGASTESLMKLAVSGMLDEWKKRFPRPGQALFFCGKGHNGNDGLWLAEELRRLGWEIRILLSHPRDERKTVPAADAIRESLANAHVWPQTPDFSSDKKGIRIVVDALLGTGATGAPHGVYADMLTGLREIQAKSDFSISVDVPSGLEADTGEVFKNAFKSDLTFCLGGIKPGLLKDKSRPWVGRLVLISLPLPFSTRPSSHAEYFGIAEAHSLARPLPAGSYKHQRGTLGIWAGSPGMGGAAALTSQSGLRAGAGLVRLYTHPDLQSALISSRPEIMTEVLTFGEIPETLLKARAWVLGPGIGLHSENSHMLKKLLAAAPCPVVLDADALTLIARDISILADCPQPLILTPHRGELERLTGKPFSERQEAGNEWLALHPSAILVAKGPNTLVMTGGLPPSFNASGNPGMATAGMGDILAGVLGSLLAQGYSPWDAARLGTYWHGAAADRSAYQLSEQCLNAADLISELGPSWKEIIA